MVPSITRGVSLPPKIDEMTLAIENILFAKVLVVVELVGHAIESYRRDMGESTQA